MREVIIEIRHAGQRLDRFLGRYLPGAPGGLLHKMLRKKNITLNDKKADGSERLQAGDKVALFFSGETLEKLQKDGRALGRQRALYADGQRALELFGPLPVLYEDAHVLLADKPAGVLSQKAKAGDLSLNEWLAGYLALEEGRNDQGRETFCPSVCNRLDRNTSGIVLCGKTPYGSRELGRLLRDRTLQKYYLLFVEGQMRRPQRIQGYLWKEEATNTVKITKSDGPEGARIVTAYRPLAQGRETTLVEAELITGKPHQIRAHLASVGFPLVGDFKYGRRELCERRKRMYGITHQLLHAYRVVFPDMPGPLSPLSGQEIRAPLPESFKVFQEKQQIRWGGRDGHMEFQGAAGFNVGRSDQQDE